MNSVRPWSCCRTCLNGESLHPIFKRTEHIDKYSTVIEITSGLKVEVNDALPQEICSVCIAFINESFKFRKRCQDAQKSLADNKLNSTKPEPLRNIKMEYEKITEIDISELLPPDDEFKDYDDNITLDNLHRYEGCKNEPGHIELVTAGTKLQPAEVITSKKNKKNNGNMKKSRRKAVKRTIDKDDSTEGVKQEIECEICHKMLSSKLSLRNHYKIHTGFDVICEHCGKKFITRRLLLMHCRAKHGYEKTDKCSFCDYRASNAEQVKIHERLHTGERPYVCKECDAEFHRKSSYLQHVAIHLPEKTVQCDVCPARFKSATLMRIHAQRHRAPQYSYACAVCGGHFARRRNVTRHLQRVHALPPDAHHVQRLKLP